jgi:hypothetical protein
LRGAEADDNDNDDSAANADADAVAAPDADEDEDEDAIALALRSATAAARRTTICAPVMVREEKRRQDTFARRPRSAAAQARTARWGKKPSHTPMLNRLRGG